MPRQETAPDPTLPRARGAAHRGPVRGISPGTRPTLDPITGAAPADVLEDDDFQLALYCCYELHYRGFGGVSSTMEWDLEVLRFRQSLERDFERALLALVPLPAVVAPSAVRNALEREIADADGPSLSEHLLDHGDRRRVPRVPGPPIGVPAQGSGPAQLGHPPLRRPGQGAR